MLLHDDTSSETPAAAAHRACLAEDDGGLTAGSSTDDDLGLVLTVSGEEVEASSAGLRALAVLRGDAESDFLVHAHAGDRVELQGLPPEFALPVLEQQGLASPAALRVLHVVLAEGGEVGTASKGIGDHSGITSHHAQAGRQPDLVGDVAGGVADLHVEPGPGGWRQPQLAGEEADGVA